MNSISDTLNKAADLIERVGWWDGGDHPGGGTCAANAIQRVTQKPGELVKVHAAHCALAEYLGATDGIVIRPITTWNDAPGQTVENVVATMRAAAVIAAANEVAVQTVTAEPIGVL